MKKNIVLIVVAIFAIINVFVFSSNKSTANADPCYCCISYHGETCLGCDGSIRLNQYNCGYIDPIDPEL
jgi:hypothetical protein